MAESASMTREVETSGFDFEAVLAESMIVFQCESCHSILGDSTYWLAACEALEAFTLSAVTDNVSRGEVLHHSGSVHDAGSAYYLLSCRRCKKKIGRYYVTTPQQLDYLRGNFTIDVAGVTGYRFGSAGTKWNCSDPPLLFELAEKCFKIQHLIVMMNTRLSNVEKCLTTDGDGEEESKINR
ncbi:protein Mis18-alpha-like isoform X2 [Pomacea canaliculata]|nr:protein Mis18-alpha-like isoform X2 [Pomacea canaliculata]XP_025105082.1 protein Mis18-alpha-like isoform X2 [Pomacea canaliculata]XP_025105083.1 protein Mis18-alpha-like isoform X2 [Pomacea canaliculata]